MVYPWQSCIASPLYGLVFVHWNVETCSWHPTF